ncbi:helix-turn-helix domain-containing protein [Flavobacterium endoglycinae]|uniref:Helix-turn-helix domain-containing protein n=1 Tax=Flavobacterium endoglycinae TaxID=2816357 RepID=A0ABX7QC00_9FLAO|nr:helix-turn-helix domain-containing protein [Flavobacterium endoglycinae]QSW88477.1 helix-turn-helix domain-containing protein [Flavobacterium endoglycinae]
MKCTLPVLLFLFLVKSLNAQKISKSVPDSLVFKTYTYLDDRIYEYKNDSLKAAPYLFAYLKKARQEKNYEETVNAYQNILHQSPMNLRLKYADSMVIAAEKSKSDELIGSANLSKGIVYYSQKNYVKAYDYYIKANESISKTENDYLIYKTKYHIAQIKYYLGFYDEAISLFTDCLEYFKKNQARPYLNSLHSLSACYNKAGDYSRCSQTNALGLAECERLKIPEMELFFKHSEGINQFFLNNYHTSIKMLQEVIPQLNSITEFANISIANFYIGKSYWKLQLPTKAIPYFKKVEKAFIEKGYIRPDLKEVFELMLKYYKKENNLKSQLYYIDQLLKADSVLTDSNTYLVGKIHKQYDTKEILLEKEKIQQQLVKEKYYDVILISVVVVLFSAVIYGTYNHFETKKRNKIKFDLLLEKNDKNSIQKQTPDKFEITDISQETVQQIIRHLEKFERDKKFLHKEATLATLTVRFNTNSKYLSKVIYHRSGKRFADYINDLKIDYLVELLRNSSLHRNYSIGSLAEEAGFTSTPRFTNAFSSRTGISVSYFLKELKKENS